MAHHPYEVSADEMAAIVHPDRWDGYELGAQGPAFSQLSPRPYMGRHKSERQLREHVGRMSSSMALEVFTDGDNFDPAASQPGDIFLLNSEAIKADGVMPSLAYDRAGVAHCELPLKPSLGLTEFNFLRATHENVTYHTSTHWGVITPTAKGNVLATVPTMHVARTGPRRALLGTMLDTITVPHTFTVGDVWGEPISKPDTANKSGTSHSQMGRVTAMELLAHGQADRSRFMSRVLALAGRVAVR